MTAVRAWTRDDAARFVRAPGADDDKYSRGVVAVRTGSDAYPGAAVLGVEAAWRSGAGYVRFVGEGRAADAVLARRPETVTGFELGRTRPDAWVIGSGTDAATRSDAESAALRTVLAGTAPVVADAGAIDLVVGATAPLIVTPHAREFAALQARIGLAPAGEPVADAVAAARVLDAAVLCKGATTIVAAPDGSVRTVVGTAWLATAGTGDVLAGIIGALCAANPGESLADIAATGAWVHSRAAERAAGAGAGAPGHPIVALDVAEALPAVVGELLG